MGSNSDGYCAVMSQHDVEALRRWTAAIQRGDYEAAEVELDLDELEVDDRDIVESTGADSHRAWLERWDQAWDTWRVEEQSVIPAGDSLVLSLFRMFVTGKGSGIELARDDALLAEFRDGKIVRLGYYNDQEQARRDADLLGWYRCRYGREGRDERSAGKSAPLRETEH